MAVPVQGKSYDIPRLYAQRHQSMCNAVGLLIQLPVGQSTVTGDDRRLVRCALGLFLKQGVDALVAGIISGGIIEVVEQCLPLLLRNCGQILQQLVFIQHLLQQQLIALYQPLNRFLRKQSGTVFHHQYHVSLAGHDVEGKIILGGCNRNRQQFCWSVAKDHLCHFLTLVSEHDVKEGITALRVNFQLLYQVSVGIVLVS